MKRKEIKSLSITQSNDASCHNRYSNGHKNRAALKRSAAHKARQALKKDLEDRARSPSD